MKIKNIIYLVFIGIILFIPTICNAKDVYYVTGDDVNFRTTPEVTNGNIIMSIRRTSIVELVTTTKTWGGGCNSGWYKIKYANKQGYVCAGYIAYGNPANEQDVYLRPWTSPKKAIIGGAKFIASSYINRGQNTSYLKKFNVTSTSTYNHQYMANLAAPYTEAYSSYLSYKENNLLNLALEFSIPVFNNMPSYTKLPGRDRDKTCQKEVKDEEFEKLLKAEGFPESYKCKLRLLHEKHPNWVFKAFKTNLDFNRAVTAEQAVSSISGGTIYYKTPYYQTEPGWYLANTETVSYYLDPRNFLNEERVLMFEDLGYKDYYNSKTIKPILKGTFMEGYSALDNQLYASIFVEAGKTAKMSSVYLASLARQESGVGGSRATSGKEFTYEGKTYKGLYNFFNIGAYSSASNPVLAGLVWASGGFDPETVALIAGQTTEISTPKEDDKPSTPEKTSDEKEMLNKINAKADSGLLTNIDIGTTIGTLKAKLKGYTITSNLTDKDVIKTGSTITIKKDKNTYKYTFVVKGDVDGDGKMQATDYVKIKNYIMETKDSKLNAAQSIAADVDGNGQIGATDYVKIKNIIMGR